MNTKQRRTLHAIFQTPTCANVPWWDIESLLRTLGAEVSEGRGSRVLVLIGENEAVFHRPHPRPDTDKKAVEAVRRFLELAGVTE